jgi:hypothetical protein
VCSITAARLKLPIILIMAGKTAHADTWPARRHCARNPNGPQSQVSNNISNFRENNSPLRRPVASSRSAFLEFFSRRPLLLTNFDSVVTGI